MDEKLATFSAITDENRTVSSIPTLPNRPKRLAFSQEKSPKFPSLEQLDDPHMRGLVFHFFANHELLALEIMAHTLLRFPDAPPEFRRGLAFIMQEEQQHLKLYLDRMQDSGVAFGDFPVNDYFWRLITPLKTIEQFTAYMSLTFEQANLDFSLQFMQAFAKIEDSKSEQLLNTVYQDEIGHVQHGLNWVNRWKPAEISLWQYYTNELEFPMTARRAKGKIYYPEARKAVGFDKDYIEKLQLYSHSKGKTPLVFSFNALAEYELQKNAEPNKYQHLNTDLEALTIFLAGADDIVLTQNTLSPIFLAKLQQASVALPELVLWQSIATLSERKLLRFMPWAKTEAETALINERKLHFAEQSHAIDADYFGKAFSVQLLADFLAFSSLPNLCEASAVGFSAQSSKDALDFIQKQPLPLILKAGMSSAGNGFRLIEYANENYTKWLNKQFLSQEKIVIETWLPRVLDFSIQFVREQTGKVRSKGVVIMENSALGKFKGLRLGPINRLLSQELLAFLYKPMAATNYLQQLQDELCAFLEAQLEYTPLYGAFGIDCFIYRNANNTLHLKPFVELNPRYTMGRVGLQLRKIMHPNATASWRILTKKDVQKLGFNTFANFVQDQEKANPIALSKNKLCAGFLATSDWHNAVDFFSYLLIDTKK
jgi:uncharacterized ferritin-like protein (DUF455 family)